MRNLRILVVGGHPADVIDHCGGMMAHHVRRGDSVTALVLTHGLRVHDIVIAEELRLAGKPPDPERLRELMQERGRVKSAEIVQACGILGVTDVRFLGYDDSVLLVTHELIEAVARVIRTVAPDIVVTHYPLENGGVGSHHANAGKIVLEAIPYAGSLDLGDPTPACRVAQVFFMAPLDALFKGSSLSAEPRAYCDYYIDITDVAEMKVNAIDAIRSQRYGGDYARKSVEIWNGKDGHNMRVAYAEGFVSYFPEIGRCLPLSEERLDRANEAEAVTRARTDVMIAPFVKLPK